MYSLFIFQNIRNLSYFKNFENFKPSKFTKKLQLRIFSAFKWPNKTFGVEKNLNCSKINFFEITLIFKKFPSFSGDVTRDSEGQNFTHEMFLKRWEGGTLTFARITQISERHSKSFELKLGIISSPSFFSHYHN